MNLEKLSLLFGIFFIVIWFATIFYWNQFHCLRITIPVLNILQYEILVGDLILLINVINKINKTESPQKFSFLRYTLQRMYERVQKWEMKIDPDRIS